MELTFAESTLTVPQMITVGIRTGSITAQRMYFRYFIEIKSVLILTMIIERPMALL